MTPQAYAEGVMVVRCGSLLLSEWLVGVGGLTPNLDRFMADPVDMMERHRLANKPPGKPINKKQPAHRVSLRCELCRTKLRRAWDYNKACHLCGGPVVFASYRQQFRHELFVSSERGASAIGRGTMPRTALPRRTNGESSSMTQMARPPLR